MLPEAPQPHGLLYYPPIGPSNFLHQFRAAAPLSRESWSCNTVIYIFQLSPLVVFERFEQPKVELCGRDMAGKYSLKMPDFHVAFRYLFHAVNLRHGTHSFTSLPKKSVLRIVFFFLQHSQTAHS
jgi:hypothetical protein